MNSAQTFGQRLSEIPARQMGFRFAIVGLLAATLLITALPPQSTHAATVGNCDTIAAYPQYSWGKIRWSGMSQCFAMMLEHGFTYTITVDAGSREFAGSNNPYEPLGDSVLILYRSNTDRIQINDPYNASYFSYVGMNDDYAIPTHLGSRISYEVTGERGRSSLFVARVSGFNSAIGTYSISVTRSISIDLDDCRHIFEC